jgi:predicted nucleotidyltransferase
VRRVLQSRADDVLAAWVFGSVGRDEMREDSDVDIAVLFARPAEPRLDALPARLESALVHALGREVQLIDVNHAPPDLVHRVLRDGELVLERDRSARIAFEVQARNAYFDLQPFLARYRGREAPGR